MRGEEVERSLVGVNGGRFVVIVRSHVAVKSVFGVRVSHNLGREGYGVSCRTQRFDLLHGNASVEVAVETNPRTLQFRRQFNQWWEAEATGLESAAVETGGDTDGAEGRGVKRDGSAHAVADDRDIGRVKAESRQEVRRGVEVVGDALLIEVRHERHRRREVVVGDLRRTVAVEQLRGDGQITLVSEAVGDVADVIVDAKGLLDNNDGARRVGLTRGVQRKAARHWLSGHWKDGPS